MYRFVLCLVFAASTLATPRSATAAVNESYDTIDLAELTQRNPNFTFSPPTLTLRGIPTGASAPVTRTYVFAQSSTATENLEAAMYCHRLAVLAMSKPGKYQFAIHFSNTTSVNVGCRLALITP